MRYPNVERMQSWEKNPQQAADFATNPHMDDIHVPNEVHVWKGTQEQPQRVLVHLRTQDVLHSFFLPHMRLKQDAVPGKVIPVWFRPDSDAYNGEWITGKGWRYEQDEHGHDKVWDLACAELCGWGHYKMQGKLFVHPDKADFMKWLKKAQADVRSKVSE